MNVSNIEIGDYFITSALPVDRAFRYGILCVSKDDQKVVFTRFTTREEFPMFVKDGEVGMGNWVKTSLNGMGQVEAIIYKLDQNQVEEEQLLWQIESATKGLATSKSEVSQVLKSAIKLS